MAKTFKQDDNEAYQKWIIANPDGFVVNTRPEKSHQYRRAHRTSCKHIIGANYPARPTKNYIKVCDNDPKGIKKWFEDHKIFDGTFGECKRCMPLINEKIR